MTQEEYIKLYEKYQEGKLTEHEERSLLNYHDDFELAEYQWDDEKMGVKADVQAEIYQQISKNIHKTSAKRNFTWLAAASILLAVFSLFYYFQSQDKNLNENQIAKKSTIQEEINPGKDGAILKLSDGSEVVLNETKDGFVKYDGNAKINKEDNLISYRGSDRTDKTAFNIIYTPRGGQYKVELEDGTKVWLNAASSLRFPTVFNDDQRVVELSGEAYFEVAKNKNKPFKVLVKDASNNQKMNVEVLGTHFNIQAYNNEDFKTTLIEGAVKVNQTQEKGFILSPGEQATLSSSDLTVQKANVKEALAWKNGLFIFNKEHIKTIMNKIARWYDVEIVYEGNMDQKTFVGTISREENLSEVLKTLELTGTIKFKVEGRKVIVK
ncbi:FecR family protein [Pedobacter aquae]|uniref:FecR family protein n=1 Tax=Pedobacter aquae TaxID=2605747 RepID=A0A5C0VE64_9SPHI|nr:FecR family protein [Pedobacter aquae]QEK50965.1 FecR family protein [Pedobacter aquae]